jgi:hypothetical protein
MKRFITALACVGLFISAPLSLWKPGGNLCAQDAARFELRVASFSTEISAQKELNRLKSFNIQAQIVSRENRFKKTAFVLSVLGYPTKEEATRYGNQLIQRGIIKNFMVSIQKSGDETPAKVEKPPLPSPLPPKKEPVPIPVNSPVYVGPIFSEETKEEKPTPVKEGPPLLSTSFHLRVASLSTLEAAQKEIKRLESFHLDAQYLVRENQSKKKLFVVYLNHFKSQEEATRKGNELVQKNIIKNFTVFANKASEETPSTKAKEAPPPPTPPSKKEPPPVPDKNLVYFGPISIKEEENALRIYISLDRKIFPEIKADKVTEGSRLIVTFKNIDRYIVPVEFEKIQSPTLLSWSLAKKGPDCTFILVLNSTFNYEVAQNYYEREKLYSLIIGREAAKGPSPVKKE